jgi:hypothetical protein
MFTLTGAYYTAIILIQKHRFKTCDRTLFSRIVQPEAVFFPY